jgi:hypothetical protein
MNQREPRYPHIARLAYGFALPLGIVVGYFTGDILNPHCNTSWLELAKLPLGIVRLYPFWLVPSIVVSILVWGITIRVERSKPIAIAAAVFMAICIILPGWYTISGQCPTFGAVESTAHKPG